MFIFLSPYQSQKDSVVKLQTKKTDIPHWDVSLI